MSGTGQKVCGGWVVVFKPTLVLSLSQAEQYREHTGWLQSEDTVAHMLNMLPEEHA